MTFARYPRTARPACLTTLPQMPYAPDYEYPWREYITPEQEAFDAWYRAELARERAERIAKLDASNRARGLPEKWVIYDRRFDPVVVLQRFTETRYPNGVA